MGNMLTGRVIKIINSHKVVINKGSEDGVELSNRFLVYSLGEELFDPDSFESLGHLELVCGEGKPEHIQERMTTLVSCRIETTKSKTVIKRGASSIFGETEETYDPETRILPFVGADLTCLVKQIQ